MAVIQSSENESGIVVAYWKVSGINLSFIGKRGFITMTGFLTKEARELNKEQVGIKQITVKPELFDQYFGDDELTLTNPKELCYRYIKDNDDFFMDSIDTIDEIEAKEPIETSLSKVQILEKRQDMADEAINSLMMLSMM